MEVLGQSPPTIHRLRVERGICLLLEAYMDFCTRKLGVNHTVRPMPSSQPHNTEPASPAWGWPRLLLKSSFKSFKKILLFSPSLQR